MRNLLCISSFLLFSTASFSSENEIIQVQLNSSSPDLHEGSEGYAFRGGNLIYGRTDADAISAGVVGEKIEDSSTSITDIYAAAPNWTSSANAPSVSLTPGHWNVCYVAPLSWNPGTVSGGATPSLDFRLSIVDGSDTEIHPLYTFSALSVTRTAENVHYSGCTYYKTDVNATLRIAGKVVITNPGSIVTAPTVQIRQDGVVFQLTTGSLVATRLL